MNAMKTKMKMPTLRTFTFACITSLSLASLAAVTTLTAQASGSYVSPNALLKKKPAAEPTPTPAPEAKKKK